MILLLLSVPVSSLLLLSCLGCFLVQGAPLGRDFGQFIEAAKVNMVGLVPSIVKAWRASSCMDNLDWSSVRLFSSTGEASSPEDYHWLSSRWGGRLEHWVWVAQRVGWRVIGMYCLCSWALGNTGEASSLEHYNWLNSKWGVTRELRVWVKQRVGGRLIGMCHLCSWGLSSRLRGAMELGFAWHRGWAACMKACVPCVHLD